MLKAASTCGSPYFAKRSWSARRSSALSTRGVLVGEAWEVMSWTAGQSPHLVATFSGRLQAGYSMTGVSRYDARIVERVTITI